jgi:hypothetical protein
MTPLGSTNAAKTTRKKHDDLFTPLERCSTGINPDRGGRNPAPAGRARKERHFAQASPTLHVKAPTVFTQTGLYEILEAHHKREPKPLNLVRPDVPVELATIVGKMMAKDPTKRYQTPIEVARALAPFFKPGQSAATPVEPKAGVNKAVTPPAVENGRQDGPITAPLPLEHYGTQLN